MTRLLPAIAIALLCVGVGFVEAATFRPGTSSLSTTQTDGLYCKPDGGKCPQVHADKIVGGTPAQVLTMTADGGRFSDNLGNLTQRTVTTDAGIRLDPTDSLVYYGGRGDTTWTLPVATTVKGQRLVVVNNTSTQAIVIVPGAGQTLSINGSTVASNTIWPGQSLHVTNDGISAWTVEAPDGEDGVWDDAQGFASLRSGATAPIASLFRSGIYLYAFQGSGSEQDLYFAVQFSHAYAGGTLKPHIHWSHTHAAGDGGAVEWYLEYSCAAPNTAYPASTTVGATRTWVAGGTDQYKQILTGFGDITPPAGCGASCICIGRIARNPADPLDDYPGLAYLSGFDWHYQRSRHGTVAPNGPR